MMNRQVVGLFLKAVKGLKNMCVHRGLAGPLGSPAAIFGTVQVYL
jgi:hypothetical protein